MVNIYLSPNIDINTAVVCTVKAATYQHTSKNLDLPSSSAGGCDRASKKGHLFPHNIFILIANLNTVLYRSIGQTYGRGGSVEISINQ